MVFMDTPIERSQLVKCHHCGNSCENSKVTFDDLHFCCSGCATVYSILMDHQLDAYYKIEQLPGIKPEETADNFSYLELPEVTAKIVQYEDENQVKFNLFVPEIHCASCIYLLENLNKIEADIHSSRVNFIKKELFISAKNDSGIYHKIFKLLHSLGYRVNLDQKDYTDRDETSKSLLIKLGITGFCFGNIMLLTIPNYLSNEVVSPFLHYSFLAISILLTLPVLLFGARDYYSKAFKSFSQKYLSIEVPIALGISALLVNSFIDIILYQGSGYFDSLAGLVFFLLIGKWFQSKTYEQFSFEKDIRSFFPIAVLKENNGSFNVSRVNDLEVGDIIKLRYGEILPVNAELISDIALFDYSFVTGESEEIKKNKKELLFAGGKLKSEAKTFEVKSNVDLSYLSELWQNQSKETKDGIKQKLDVVSHYFTITIILIALLGFSYWAMNGAIQKAIIVFTSTLIVACPCALALAQPFTYGSADRLLGQNGIYLKNSQVIERLSTIKSVVLDKTGTMTVTNSEQLTYLGTSLREDQINEVAAVCSSSIHPISQLISSHFTGRTNLPKINSYKEFPGKGIRAVIADNGYMIFIGSLNWMQENKLDDSIISDLKFHKNRSRVFIGINNSILGLFEISDRYRPGMTETIENLQQEYEVAILSGDKNKEEEYLKTLLSHSSDILFEQSPIDKLEFIKKKQKDNPVLMVGDGINDSGALAESAIGISITEQSGHFTPASDIIMKSDKINQLLSLLNYAKDSQKVLYFGLLISFLYNSIGIFFAINGLLSPFVAAILMPISSITVVALSTSLTFYFAKKRNLHS